MNRLEVIKSTVGQPTLGCEVGVWEGQYSRALLKEFPNLTLLMVDRYELYKPGGRGVVSQVITQSGMNAAMLRALDLTSFAKFRRILLVADSVLASRLITAGTLDFCNLDAGHSYEQVSCDLEAYYPKVRPGGLFFGDDYGCKTKAYQVKRAVDKFAKKRGYDVNVTGKHTWWFVKR